MYRIIIKAAGSADGSDSVHF